MIMIETISYSSKALQHSYYYFELLIIILIIKFHAIIKCTYSYV